MTRASVVSVFSICNSVMYSPIFFATSTSDVPVYWLLLLGRKRDSLPFRGKLELHLADSEGDNLADSEGDRELAFSFFYFIYENTSMNSQALLDRSGVITSPYGQMVYLWTSRHHMDRWSTCGHLKWLYVTIWTDRWSTSGYLPKSPALRYWPQ